MVKVPQWVCTIFFCLVISSGWILAQEEKKEPAVTEATETVEENVPEEEKKDEAAPEEALAEKDEISMEEEIPTEEPSAEEIPEEPTEAEPELAPAEEAAVEEATQEMPVEEELVDQMPPEEEVAEKEEVPEQPELGPDEIMGIDTVDLEDPQGNWLYKRVWWERAESKYEKIQNAVTTMLEMRTGFFAKRAELDKTVLDPFYIKIGMSQGELQEILKELLIRATKEAKDKKDERLVERAEADKKELEQLQKDVQSVVAQDEEVENAILMLVEQLNKAHALKNQAWNDFKNIARVLDDKKARELFYKVDNAWRNIQEIKGYVEQTFTDSFDQLVERIKKQVNRIDDEVASLKEKGIDLKNKILGRPEIEQEEPEEEPSKGMVTRYIVDPIQQIFQSLWQLIRWPIDKIMGWSPPAEEMDEEEVEGGVTPEKEVQELVMEAEFDEEREVGKPITPAAIPTEPELQQGQEESLLIPEESKEGPILAPVGEEIEQEVIEEMEAPADETPDQGGGFEDVEDFDMEEFEKQFGPMVDEPAISLEEEEAE